MKNSSLKAPRSVAIFDIDIIDEEFLPEGPDRSVHRQRDQGARCDYAFDFDPTVADIDGLRFLADDVPEAGSNHRQAVAVGEGSVDRQQGLHHVSVDDAVLIEQQRPRESEGDRALNADIQRPRNAEIVYI